MEGKYKLKQIHENGDIELIKIKEDFNEIWIKNFIVYLSELQDKAQYKEFNLLYGKVSLEHIKGYNECLNDIVRYVNQNKPL
jgi:hypothetical protein